jgi:hypothetical protein
MSRNMHRNSNCLTAGMLLVALVVSLLFSGLPFSPGPVQASAAPTNLLSGAVGSWSPLDTGVQGGGVNAVAVDPASGIVYVGGSFTGVGTCTSACKAIAQWDPATSTWSDMDGGIVGVNSSVKSIAIDPTTHAVYVGGSFTSAGTCGSASGCNHIAKWDPTTRTWSNLGTGISGVAGTTFVFSVAIDPDGMVYAGGEFTGAGTCLSANGCKRIAKWDPATSTWSALGTGVNATLYAIAVSSTNKVYAGGAFTVAGTCNSAAGCNSIAQWDPATSIWSAVGGGVGSGSVFAIAVSSSGIVYAGGSFSPCFGCDRIAKLDPSAPTPAWSAMGGGMQSMVSTIAVSSSGTVYAGGQFTYAGTCYTGCGYIAQWKGTAWSALDGGTNNTVAALALSSAEALYPDLYAGGDFTTAGTCNAAAGCSKIAVLVGGPPAAVITFGTAPAATYLGGNFTVSASSNNTDTGGNVLTYSVDSGPCALVSGATFSSSGAGACVVKASGPATTNFSAGSKTQTVTIAKAAAVVTFDPAPSPTYLGSDFTVSATTTNGDSAELTYSYVSGTCTWVSGGTFSSTGPGGCVIKASGAATANYAAASNNQTVTIAKAVTTITFDPAPTVAYLGGSFVAVAVADSGATVTYSYVSGPCTWVSGGTFNPSGAGDCVVKASAAATTTYAAANLNQTVTIDKANNAIAFDPAPTPTYLGGSFTVVATSDSPAVVTYTKVSGPCTQSSGGTFTSSGAGDCTVKAEVAATANFVGAFDTQIVSIVKAAPTLSFGAAPSPTYLGGNFTVSATTSNLDPAASVVFSYVSGPCAQFSLGTFSSSGGGDCVIQADSPATDNYAVAASKTQTVTIARAAGTITFDPAPTATFLGGSFVVAAGADSGAPITYSVDSGPCTWVSGRTFNPTGAGDCVVKADALATTDYTAATSNQTVSIAKASTTINFTLVPTPVYLGGNFIVAASASSGGAVVLSRVSGPCFQVSGDTFSSSGAGDCVISADAAALSDYVAASKSQTISIDKASPQISFDSAPGVVLSAGDFTVHAVTNNSDSALLSYSYVSGPCTLVSGATFTPTAEGNCVVQADSALTTNFKVGSQTFSVAIMLKIPGVITFDAAPTPVYLGGDFTVSASANSSALVSYTYLSGPCTQVSAGTFSSTGAGDCVIQAASLETNDYFSASQNQTVTIAKSLPVISFSSANKVFLNAGDFTVSASTSNTDSSILDYSVVSGACTLVNGAVFHPTGTGDCVVRADGAASANFTAAHNEFTITINQLVFLPIVRK